MAEIGRKGKSAAEIAALTGGDIEPLKEAFNGVCILYGDEESE
jgi:hypothetical protein